MVDLANFFIRKFEKYLSYQGRQLPKETKKALGKKPDELNLEEYRWFSQNVEPYMGFISSGLEAMYLQEGKPHIWSKELARNHGTIIEKLAQEVVAAHERPEPAESDQEEAAEGEIVSDGGTLTGMPGMANAMEKRNEETYTAATMLIQKSGSPGESEKDASEYPGNKHEEGQVKADAVAAEGETDDEDVEPAEDQPSEAKPTEIILTGAASAGDLAKAEELEGPEPIVKNEAVVAVPPTIVLKPKQMEKLQYGVTPAMVSETIAKGETPPVPETLPLDMQVRVEDKPDSWLKRHKIVVLISTLAAVVIGVSVFLAIFFLAGRRQVIYEWSRSDRIGNDLRVERSLIMEKNAGDSPFRFTVELRIENLGHEQLGVLQVEEQLPDILRNRGGFVFDPETDRDGEEGRIVAWEDKNIGEDEFFKATYYLPLQAELSKPQLEDIEEHFGEAIIAYIGLPENEVKCGACEGAGYNPCQACEGVGSSVCSACRGSGTRTCSTCNGKGTCTCPKCAGEGIYWICNRCGAALTRSQYYSSAYCPYCGRANGGSNSYACNVCSRTGVVKCGTCGGSGQARCGQCGGSGRLVCASCGGSGKTSCPNCQGSGKVAFTYGESKIYAGGEAAE